MPEKPPSVAQLLNWDERSVAPRGKLNRKLSRILDRTARATAAEARIEVLEEALRKYMAATPEHDYSCGVGPLYRCTCDLHEANEAARQALKGSTDG